MDTGDVLATPQQRQSSGERTPAREFGRESDPGSTPTAFGQVIRFFDWLLRIFPA